MRRCLAVLACLICSVALADPPVRAHISREDVQQICFVVSRATREPITSISAQTSARPVPGAIPYDAFEGSSRSIKRVTRYERTDLVSVHTGDFRRGVGDVYDVQKIGNTWKIVGKGIWIR
jgi:hypothetical protein